MGRGGGGREPLTLTLSPQAPEGRGPG
jgi:hypothetical protein